MDEFNKMVAEMAATAERMKKELEEKQAALKKKEEAIEQDPKFQDVGPAPKETKGEVEEEDLDEFLELNVGGQHFSTLKSTLLKYPGTFFTVLFSGKYPVPRDLDGRIFIDRPPQPFAMILNWLRRGGNLTKKELKTMDKEIVLAEVEYYGLTDVWNAASNKIQAVPVEAKRVLRLSRMGNTTTSWNYSGTPDRIIVSPSRAVQLWGIGLYGADGATANISITQDQGTKILMTMDNVNYTKLNEKRKKKKDDSDSDSSDSETDTEEEELAKVDFKPLLPKDKEDKVHDILFRKPIVLKKNMKYIIAAKITGSSSPYGQNGKPSMKAKKVTFTFTKTSSDNNATDENRGQIPCLLWLPIEKQASD